MKVYFFAAMCMIPTCILYSYNGRAMFTDHYVSASLKLGYSFTTGCTSCVFYVLAIFHFLIPYWRQMEREREQAPIIVQSI